MPVTKKGAKVLKKDHADLKKNAPKIDKDGDLFIVKIYSNVNKGYISVAEYTNMKTARADLKHFQKDHKETLDKILRLSKDIIKESLDEGLRLPTDVAKKLKASVASKAKGKIIPFVSRFGSKEVTFGYDDAKGEKHKLITLKRKVSKEEEEAIVKYIRDKHSVNEAFKKGQKVKVINKNDDFFGKTGEVYRVGTGKTKGGQTILFGKDIVSFNDDEIELVEGFGADTQKKKQDASKAMWDKLVNQHKDNKALIKKATQYYNKNMKPEFAFKKAMSDLKESIDILSVYRGKPALNEAGKIKGETVFIDYDNGFYMVTGSKSLFTYEYLESMKDVEAYVKKNKLKVR